MKAIVYEKYGPPEVLHIADVEKPLPQANEILIRIKAAEATKADCEMRSFHFPVKWFWLPLRIAVGIRKPKNPILGGYYSGVVESAGKNVSRFKPGDSVFGAAKLKMRAYGEYLCLPDNYTMALKPSNMSFAEAAAVPLGGLNALHFLRKANIQKGESVLINGAGGSIGTFAVQIARAAGAIVTAVDSGIKEEMLRSIGADHFIDYAKVDFTESGQTYDVIFNMVARNDYSKSIKLLKPKGRYLTGNPKVSDMLRSILTSWLTNKSAIFAFAEESQEQLEALKDLIEAGKIESVVDKVYTMEQAAEAHRRVETEQRIGTVVILMGNEDACVATA